MTEDPARQQLELLLEEQLSRPVAERIEAHVQSCARCQQTLDGLSCPDPTAPGPLAPGHEPRPEFLRRLREASADAVDGPGQTTSRSWVPSSRYLPAGRLAWWSTRRTSCCACTGKSGRPATLPGRQGLPRSAAETPGRVTGARCPGGPARWTLCAPASERPTPEGALSRPSAVPIAFLENEPRSSRATWTR